MKDIRLLPIVLFAVSALLVLKVVGVITGSGSFAIGAGVAVAADGKSGDAPVGANVGDPLLLGPPLDLAREYKEIQEQQKAAESKAEGESEVAADSEDGADPAAAETPPEGQPASAEQVTDGGASASGPVAPAADGAEAPAAAGQDGAAEAQASPPADGQEPDANGKGEEELNYTTQRPEEFQPMRSPSEVALEKALGERRKTLDQREEDLTTRLKLLEAAEGRLQARLDEMRALQERFDAQAASAGPGPSEQIKGLVSMYENMKPKAAAAVFNQLDLPILIELSKSMNPRKMSAILAVMNPDRASNLTTALAAIGMTQQARSAAAPARTDAGPATTQSIAPADDLENLPKIMPAAPQN